jgi:hypothetical protein
MNWSASDLIAAEEEVGQRRQDLPNLVVRVLVRAASREVSPDWGRPALVEGALLQEPNFNHVFQGLS